MALEQWPEVHCCFEKHHLLLFATDLCIKKPKTPPVFSGNKGGDISPESSKLPAIFPALHAIAAGATAARAGEREGMGG